MAQEQIEVEFIEELQQLQQLQMAVQQNPMLQQDPNTQQQLLTLTLALEARKSKLIAEMTQEFKEEENKIMGDFGNDPVAKLKARELDLRAMDDQRKREEGEERLNLDKMRAMMNQENQEEKLDQNEELAKLRANTSIEKTILSKTIPSAPKLDSPIGNVAIIRNKN
jgi:signal transduction histidine kinase